ncbi:MAG TPA: hypothetical protein ENI69_09790, partial [Rhodospirillales bacterium]|nr:hypothetical protein [Rhodospirillales bacterium]
MTSRADVQDKLALLKQSYLDRLPDQFSAIADATAKLKNRDGSAAVSSVEILKSQAHKLAGSG